MTIYRKGEQCRGYLASFSTQTGFASGIFFYIFKIRIQMKKTQSTLISGKDGMSQVNLLWLSTSRSVAKSWDGEHVSDFSACYFV